MTIRKVLFCLYLATQISACNQKLVAVDMEPSILFFEDINQAQKETEAGFKAYESHQYGKAIELYQNALSHLPRDQESVRADVYYKIGRTQLKLDNFQSAINAFEDSLKLQQKQYGNDQDRGILHNMLGLVYEKVGNVDKAREHLSAALELRRKTNDPIGEAKTLGNLGIFELGQGRYLIALEHYQAAHRLFLSLSKPNPQDVGNVLTNLGSVYAEMGQYHKALSYQQQALRVFNKAKDKGGIAATYHNIGYIEAEQLHYPKAISALKKAIALREKLQDKFGMAESSNSLGMALSDYGKHEEALTVLLTAIPVLEALDTRTEMAATYDSIGSVYARMGKYAPAMDYFQKALLVWQSTGDRENLRITLGNMGDALKRSGRNTLAIVFYKQAVNTSEAIRNDLRALPTHDQKAYLNRVKGFYRSLADLLLQQDRVMEAQQVLDLLKIQEASTFLGPVRGNNISASGVSTLPPEQDIAKRYLDLQQDAIRIGKDLAELNGIDKQSRTDEQNKRLELLSKKEQQLQRSFMRFIESDEITALVDQLSREVRNQMPALEQLRPLQDNLGRLGSHVVLLYPVVLQDRLEIVLASAAIPPLHVPVSVDHEKLNHIVMDFRKGLTKREGDVKQSAEELYRLLIAPIAPSLKELAADTILYAPDGVLRYVPLAALYDGEHWLAESYKINNITAFSLTDLNTSPVSKPKILAAAFAKGEYKFSIAGQAFNFKGLPFAKQEIDNLGDIYPAGAVEELVDDKFIPASVIPELNSFNILHFATHAALVLGKPYESFILFGNGERVTVDQVKYEWTLKNVDLIVLSACETALGTILGKGEEILGLGFLMEQAGARATMASLWKVDDGGTQRLMTAFYRTLKTGNSKAEALQQAQLAMIKGANDSASTVPRGVTGEEQDITGQGLSYSHPYYWSSFILIGNGM